MRWYTYLIGVFLLKLSSTSALTISQKVGVGWVILKLNLRCLCNNKFRFWRYHFVVNMLSTFLGTFAPFIVWVPNLYPRRLNSRHSLARFVRRWRLDARFCGGVGPVASKDFRRRVETARGGVTRDSPQSSRKIQHIQNGIFLMYGCGLNLRVGNPRSCFLCVSKKTLQTQRIDLESFSCMIVINQQSIYSFFIEKLRLPPPQWATQTSIFMVQQLMWLNLEGFHNWGSLIFK